MALRERRRGAATWYGVPTSASPQDSRIASADPCGGALSPIDRACRAIARQRGEGPRRSDERRILPVGVVRMKLSSGIPRKSNTPQTNVSGSGGTRVVLGRPEVARGNSAPRPTTLRRSWPASPRRKGRRLAGITTLLERPRDPTARVARRCPPPSLPRQSPQTGSSEARIGSMLRPGAPVWAVASQERRHFPTEPRPASQRSRRKRRLLAGRSRTAVRACRCPWFSLRRSAL